MLQSKNFSIRSKDSLIVLVVLIFLALTIFGVSNIMHDDSCASCAAYKAIAFVVIMLWLSIFIGYFIWATYFYNLNYGVSKKVWEKIETEKGNKASGKAYDQDMLDDEPLYNPYKEETFGLPPGTVRGMIAFTLLFGAIALLIVSFGMKNEIEPGNFYRDQFEFFKTAFLMMVAFYFGTRSLKYLKGEQPLSQYNTAKSQKISKSTESITKASNDGLATEGSATKKNEVVVIDSTNPLGAIAQGVKMPPITAIDPMA